MIKIIVATDGDKVIDTLKKKNETLEEVSVVVYRLEQMIQRLINLKFEEVVFKK